MAHPLQSILDEANATQEAGRDEDAIPIFEALLRKADHPIARNNLGVAYFRLGRLNDAEAQWRAALRLQPQYEDVHLNLAALLRNRGDLAGAVAHLTQAGANRATAWNDLGVAFAQAGDPVNAVACYNRALAADPRLPGIYNNMGVTLAGIGQREDAIRAYREAIALRPRYTEAWVNLGAAYGTLDPEQALACARAGVLCDPENADAHHNLGLALLAQGRYEEAWPEFAWWDRTPQAQAESRRFNVPLWDGGALDGTLLLHCQQGYGDAIQFIRFARNLPVTAVLECPAPLAALFAPIVPTIPRGTALPEYAAHCPLHLLPMLRNAAPNPFPYLTATPGLFADRLAALPGRKIGLCWAGNPNLGKRAGDKVDNRRSLPLTALDSLADLPGIDFIALNPGTPPDPTARLKPHDWTKDLTDFAATARLIAGLERVITVDTAVAHLAAAMGKPVWLLNRCDSDWRWGLGREDSDWYLAVRQFRQDRPGDWPEVIRRVRDALLPPPVDILIEEAEAAWAARAESPEARLAAARANRRLAATAPDNAVAQCNLGQSLAEEGNLPAAEAAYRASLLAEPDFVPALVNLGALRRRRGDLEDAIALTRRALSVDPDQPVARLNLATMLTATGGAEEAIRLLQPLDYADAHINMAIAMTRLHFPQQAILRLRDTLRADPGNPRAELALAEALLLDGQYREGFHAYAARWRTGAAGIRATDAPAWDGGNAQGKTVLVRAEQGMGDTIQFARFLTAAAERARIIVQAPTAVCRLLTTVAGVAAVAAREGPSPKADFQCYLLDLPDLLGARWATIPRRTPYLAPPADEAAAFAARLAALPGRRIGLVWAGNPALRDTTGDNIDARRSIKPSLLVPLSRVPNISWISLQHGPNPTPNLPLTDWTSELTDFASTAALIAGLDLVIGVDTATTHLAAALNKPTWLLNRFDTDWRWGLNTTESLWYPSMRQFRQPSFGDWPAVIADVASALRGK